MEFRELSSAISNHVINSEIIDSHTNFERNIYNFAVSTVPAHGLAALDARESAGIVIETVSPEGTFCDTVQIPSSVGDMELI